MMENIKISKELQDIIRISGVRAKGFGILPKFVMLDTDLSLEAKTIYSYFCSHSGGGSGVFPGRERILLQLHVSKDRYYKHFKQLREQGYITVYQERGQRFLRNIYSIESNPKKYYEASTKSIDSDTYSKIRINGLETLGYGMIPKAVMIDNRLDIKAKGIYSYFCAFTGSGDSAFPSLKNILYHLNISEKTYYRYYKCLIELNYISAVQRHLKGQLSINDYYLNSNPDISHSQKKRIQVSKNKDTEKSQQHLDIIQVSKNKDTEKSQQHLDIIQVSKNKDTQYQDTQYQDTQNQDTQNQDINNNSSFNNSSLQYQSINQQLGNDGLIDIFDNQEIEVIDLTIKTLYEDGLPYYYKNEYKNLCSAIYILAEYDIRGKNGYQDEWKQNTYQLCVDCLIDICSFDGEKTLVKQRVTYSKAIDKINSVMEKGINAGVPYVTLLPVIEAAMEDYNRAMKITEIKNHFGYMQACLWRSFTTKNEKDYNALAQNGYIE